jgi:1-deoxy-D-xylulose-5-phosphate reductoisomerase
VIRNNPNEFEVVAISAGFSHEIDQVVEIINEFKPVMFSMVEENAAIEVHNRTGCTYYFGDSGLVNVATSDCDTLVNAVVGSVGLEPTCEAIKKGTDIALANKETLVTAGDIVMNLVNEYGVRLLPVDSEHSAIFQCLQGEDQKAVNKLIITASGGSFRDKTREDLIGVSVDDALNHPNWSMGAKITIDSASMMNKGLEVIEAHHLFGIDYDDIEVLLHRQSVVHSMVEFNDRSVIAHLGSPDMRIPIQYALSYDKRLPFNSERLDLKKVGQLTFEELNFERFPCIDYAFKAGRIGHTMPTVLNAANEAAVSLFLSNKIEFLDIEKIVKEEMDQHQLIENPTLAQITKLDREIKESVKGRY